MNREPVLRKPASAPTIFSMASTDSFVLGFSSSFAGAAITDIRPVSIILGFLGLVSLYFFIYNYTNGNEISVLRKNFKWFNTYSLVTYISVAIAGFSIHFDALAFFTIITIFPALINAGLVRPFITINLYKKSYTRLFGVIDA